MPRDALQCSWTVIAGIIPGQADKQFTKSWELTSGQFEGPDRTQRFVEMNAAVETYALFLRMESAQGRSVNWVRVEFVWY